MKISKVRKTFSRAIKSFQISVAVILEDCRSDPSAVFKVGRLMIYTDEQPGVNLECRL